MADKIEVGKVTHYFDKLKVAIIKLTRSSLKIGDKVGLVSKSGLSFTQEVSSMQIEHAQIDIAKKGDTFGLKTDTEVKKNTKIFKIL